MKTRADLDPANGGEKKEDKMVGSYDCIRNIAIPIRYYICF